MPNSILWIGLVVMWVFVLFPMLADRHPRIRQTTDVALATRVLHRGGTKRKTARGPAAGHVSDPNWQRALPGRSAPTDRTHRRGDAEDPMDTNAAETKLDDAAADAPERETPARAEQARRDTSRGEQRDTSRGEHRDTERGEQRDASGERTDGGEGRIPIRRGRGGFDPEADAIARAARYQFRQRAVLAMVLVAILSAALGLVMSSLLWWLSGATVVVLVLYLVYLRRQVRMEDQIRRRRMARMARARLGVESTTDKELQLVPARLRRPGATVLEIDDGDPVFDHLDHPGDAARDEAEPERMRTAAGQ